MLCTCFFARQILAATGIIDATHKYAWANRGGWINFNSANGNVSISDTAITGYAWNELYGWINLGPAGSGIVNNSSGILSGYAWGESAGWINFAGTIINCSGKFTGTATGDTVGTITFDCENCNVTTTWLPSSGCGGGGEPPVDSKHNECNSQKQCVSVSGDGTSQCQTDNDCVTHNECNAQKQCLPVSGIGSDQCQQDSDCNIVHNECSAEKCESVQGAGTSQCNVDADCLQPKHNECNLQEQCISVDGDGLDQCSVDLDCGPTHNECNNLQCVVVFGAGIDQCQKSEDCLVLSNHNECLEKKCVSVDGVGSDQCQQDSDCNIVHNECNENRCVSVEGVGVSQCQEDSECQQGKHNECQNKKCVATDGSGPDLCQQDGDCFQNHNECSNQQCVSVAGVGINQCVLSSDCSQGKHNECQNSSCVSVGGNGSDQCQTSNDCGSGSPVTPAEERHNECNAQKQCVSVAGVGDSQCQVNNDCEEKTEPLSPVEISTKIIEEVVKVPEEVKVAVKEVKKIVESPQGSVATKTISTTGAVVATAQVAATLAFSPVEIFLVLFRLFGIFLTVLGIKRKVKPWGVVYDSVTKQPIDPAYVSLSDVQGKIVASAITDLDGRYGFLVPAGVYRISANKTNYAFPSQKLTGRMQDELYNGLYFGDNVEVKQDGEVIARNIPMDPLKFDWNEFAKKDKKLMKFYSNFDVVSRKIFDWFFVVGFVVAIVSYFFAPYPYNLVILFIYLALLLLRAIGLKPKAYGRILDGNGNPMSFALLRVVSPGTNVEVAHKAADKYGRYYCLVPAGSYFVKIEKKNDDGSYSLSYTSPAIDVSKKGIIKNIFRI